MRDVDTLLAQPGGRGGDGVARRGTENAGCREDLDLIVEIELSGTLEARPVDGLAIDFVVEADRAQLSEIVQRVRNGRLRTNIGTVATLDAAVAAFNSTERIKGKTVIRVRP